MLMMNDLNLEKLLQKQLRLNSIIKTVKILSFFNFFYLLKILMIGCGYVRQKANKCVQTVGNALALSMVCTHGPQGYSAGPEDLSTYP
jgi:hypothetical protein